MSAFLRYGCHGNLAVIIFGDATFGSTEMDKHDALDRITNQIATQSSIRRIIVDLSETKSYGARLCGQLVALHRECVARNVAMSVTGDHLAILKACHVDGLFPVCESLHQAAVGIP